MKSVKLLTFGLVCLLSTSCSTLQGSHFGKSTLLSGIKVTIPVNATSNLARLAMRSGIDAIIAGDAKRANYEFNLALAHDMKSPGLHVANALAYQIRARTGEPDLFNLAETGYLVALEQQHDFQIAAMQLAHLYLEHKRYMKAQQAALYVLKLDPSNTEAMYLLAHASYNMGDITLALWAIDQARRYAPQDKLGARILPVIYAAAGLADEASAFIDGKQNIFGKQLTERERDRVAQWKLIYKIANSPDNVSSKAQPGISLPKKPYSDNILDTQATSESTINESNRKDLGPLAYAWSDCTQTLTGNGNYNQSSGSSVQGDETMAMPSLPSPCKGRAMPKMARIDVVILRTNALDSTTNGINLLQNLAVTLQQTYSRLSSTATATPAVITSNVSRNIGIGTSAGSAVAYSLNIANAIKQTTDVVAHPSLLVLDRQPARFFSGSNVSIGLAGSNGAASSLERINIGVSLSITPTFVHDPELLLNVKAVRSFFEPIAGSSTFAESIQTSRNMVSAAARVKYNETLVLSGLTENEQLTGSSGVPILKDIPGVSYFFAKKTKQNISKTVLILITPKKIMDNRETLAKINDLNSGDIKKAYETEPEILQKTRRVARKILARKWPGFYHRIQNLTPKDRAFSARTKDIELNDWERPARIQTVLQDAANYQ